MACLLWLGKICNRPLDGFELFLALCRFAVDAITGASNWLWLLLLLLLIDHVGSLVVYQISANPLHLPLLGDSPDLPFRRCH